MAARDRMPPGGWATFHEITREDLALTELVRDAQAAAAVAEHQLREGAN
jgi:hypothetical protein